MIINRANLEALRTGFKTNFQAGIALAAPVSGPLVTEISSSTKIETYGFLGDLPVFRKWVGEKRIKSIEEKSYQLINDDFETTLGIHKSRSTGGCGLPTGPGRPADPSGRRRPDPSPTRSGRKGPGCRPRSWSCGCPRGFRSRR